MRMHGLMRTAAAIAATMLLCAGCGQSDAASAGTAVADRSDGAARSQSANVPAGTRTTDDGHIAGLTTTSPFDGYFLGNDDQRTVEQAIVMMNTACMAERGYRYEYTGGLETRTDDPEATYAPEWGPLTVDWARDYGYAPQYDKMYRTAESDQPAASSKATTSSKTTANAQARSARSASGDATLKAPSSPGYVQALANQDGTGCDNQTTAALGYDAEWFARIGTYDAARRNADENALRDARVTGAISEWKACMAGKGYGYDDPRDIAKHYAQSGPAHGASGVAHTVTDEERAVAVADAGCKASSDLMRTVTDVTYEYEAQAVRDNQSTMDAIKRLSATILANARHQLATTAVNE
ncbi:hypothetical protein [Bifidobacterium parmae]|uniref:Lipoprotein n=1 Tax=Bifidobacterium parmae TaxID=361854 RepID=A0A2N5IVP8_9BIFI|nr:hypothetical protein [Bifidobacterium parmae]PLS26042.1 hypothetical protein Uis4E_2160 [Bifidobacterium parmae]